MCLLSSVELRLDSELNGALWLASLSLNAVAVNPTYVSVLSSLITVAWYTISLLRQFPSKGHAAFFGQLQFLVFSVLLFSRRIFLVTFYRLNVGHAAV